LALSTSLLVAGGWNPDATAWILSAVAWALLPFAWRSTVVPVPWVITDLAPATTPDTTPAPHHAPHLAPAHRPHPGDPPLYTGLPARIAELAPRLLPLVALVGAVELWCYAVWSLDLNAMGASGVIGVVGWAYVLCIAILAAVAGWAMRRDEPDTLLMTAAVVALIIALFGLVNAADSAPSFRTAWVHVGFIDHISKYGAIATGYDARFSWPGFFAGAAVLVHLAGLPDAESLIRWAPVVYNLLAFPALLYIGRALTGSRRAAWLGLVLYACFNWFSQDYLSPQATVLLLYVGVVATLLATAEPVHVAVSGAIRRVVAEGWALPARPTWLTTPRALIVEALLALICYAAVVSHQLTPVALTGVLFAFAVTGATRYRLLWLIAGLAFLAWFSFGAEDFWRGHLGYVFGDLGKLGSTLGSSVGERLQGNAVHGRMQRIRLLWSAGSLALAGVGLWLRRDSSRPLLLAALAFGPFGLLALQSYGGEVALRSFVYAQPAIAPLAALTVLWVIDALPRRDFVRPLALSALVGVAALVLTATRGANAGFERVTSTQVAVARTMSDAIPKGSRIGLMADAGPLGLERLTDFEAISFAPDVCGSDIVRCIRRSRPDYLYVTSTMDVLGQLQFGEPKGWTQKAVDELLRLHLYRRLLSAPDALVLGLRTQS
jgi:hypothetical protein